MQHGVMSRSGLVLRPLPASMALLCAGIGALVLIPVIAFALVPILVTGALILALVVGALVFGWAGIEALAALERWIESDPRFQR